jgi:hypothetical protein
MLRSVERWDQYDEVERSSRDVIEVLAQNLLGETDENHKNLTEDNRYPGWGSNTAPPKYKSRAL